MDRLWKIIKKIEEEDGIKNMYLHRNYYTCDLELNIEFYDEKLDNKLLFTKIGEPIDESAIWE